MSLLHNTADFPELIFDYYGFPEESYHFEYAAPGSQRLAGEIVKQLNKCGINAKANPGRCFDHGTFVPLKIMYPNAKIPVIQVSLLESLSPQKHFEMGRSLSQLAKDDILIIGSGLSFHNLSLLMRECPQVLDWSRQFDYWLNETVVSDKLSEQERELRLTNWKNAPHARFAHPRDEHLTPLFFCYGAASELNMSATNIFDNIFLNTKISSFMWQ